MSRITAVLAMRCPHCQKGPIFTGFLKMHTHCPVCGVKYEREDGYFMMSVFVGYVMSAVLAVPVIVILYLNDAEILTYVWVTAVVLFALSPLIFHYARVIWMHIDELLDPR